MTTSSWRRLFRNAAVVCASLSALVLAAVLVLRETGAFQGLELIAYDQLVRARATAAPRDMRIVLVGATEEDLGALDWPVNDKTLSQLINALAVHRPRAIGIDLYRDVPKPPGSDELDRALQTNDNVIAVMKIGEGKDKGVRPPAALRESKRVGFADVVPDPGGIVRRGLLFIDDGTVTHSGFSLLLALKYLAPAGIALRPSNSNSDHVAIGKAAIPPFEPNDGGYVRADAGGYQFLLDYLGGPAPFEMFTFSQVLSGQVPGEALRDKIIIVGVVAQSVKDYFDTPFSRGADANRVVHGITLHGHSTSQLLRMAEGATPVVQVAGKAQELLLCVLWIVLGSIAGLRARSLPLFALAAVGGIGAIVAVSYVAFHGALWLPVVPQSAGWLLALALVAAYLSRAEKLQREQLMQLFSRYVSRDVATDIWEHRDDFLEGSGRPRPQRMTVTVLFSDIRDFTTISERSQPEMLMEWLTSYMDAMASLVNRHGGVVNQFIGDAVMAIFGVPRARTTAEEQAADAVNAVNCALAMRAELARLNSAWKARGWPEIAIRVGIHTGPVSAGCIGSTERMAYTVIGDTVNTASRLESYDKSVTGVTEDEQYCRILIGQPTLELVGARYDVWPLGEISLKGKAQGIKVFGVSR